MQTIDASVMSRLRTQAQNFQRTQPYPWVSIMQTCARQAPRRCWVIAVFSSPRPIIPGMPSRRFSVHRGICARFLSWWPTVSPRR